MITVVIVINQTFVLILWFGSDTLLHRDRHSTSVDQPVLSSSATTRLEIEALLITII